MLKSLVKTIIGNRHDREVKKLQPVVDEINRIQEGLAGLSDDELRGKTFRPSRRFRIV